MSDSAQELPPFRIMPHLQAAFGGLFGTLNLLVGAVSIARQIAHAFSIGLSPVLKNIFAAYVGIFHGMVDFLVSGLSWISGFNMQVPVWAHDWIILWFVGAGAAYRVHTADARAAEHRDTVERGYLSWSEPPGLLLRWLRRLRWSLPRIFRGTPRDEWKEPRWYELALAAILTYLVILVAWPLILLEVLLFRPHHTPTPTLAAFKFGTRVSYLALFWLQTLAIILAIIGLSVLNAQTM